MGSGPMHSNTTVFHLTAAIAGAESRIAELARNEAGTETVESESARELMKTQLGRLQRHCLAVANRPRGPLH